MSHEPSALDVKTDIQRCILASYSAKGFEDSNYKYFLRKAEDVLKRIDLNAEKRDLIYSQFKKAMNYRQAPEKRREDLLMVASLV